MPSGVLLTGKRFGYLMVGRELKCDVYRCVCRCGETIKVFRSQLTKSAIRHCGCRNKRVRHKQSPRVFGHVRYHVGRDGRRHQHSSSEYLTWAGVKNRCKYKTCTSYPDYGGRGIEICSRWVLPNGVGFQNFLSDMGPRPVGKTLDRKNPNGHYCKENCRWADGKVQMNNRRCSFEAKGIELPPVVPMDDLDENPFACG